MWIDTGVGIPVELQGKLLMKFFQVHNQERDRKKGFGLGLAIARRLARQIGGDLVAESALGMGSRFSIILPAHEPQSADTMQQPGLNPSFVPGMKTVSKGRLLLGGGTI